MDGPSSVCSVVVDVFRPGFALDVDQDASLGALEVHGDDRWQVSVGVLEREEVSRESSAWDVVDRSDVLVVGRVLTGARHPDDVGVLVASAKLGADVLPEILGHEVGQVLGSVVQVRDPVEDLVELQEYARALLLEVVPVRLGAGSPLVHRNFADLALWRRSVERAIYAVVLFLVVGFQEIINLSSPGFDVTVVRGLVPDQRTLDVGLVGHRPEAETWIRSYQRFSKLKFGHLGV